MKRHFNLLASVLLVIAMVFAFASCDVIGQYIPGINQPEPEHQHAFVDGSCECGEADPNYVAPHEHNFVEGKCECGETDPNYTKPECAEHAYGAAVVTKEATCTESGSKTLTCTVCGYVNELEIAPTGHTETKVPGYDPTCTAAGLSDGKVCSVCETVTVEQVEINAVGHAFVEGVCGNCGDADPNYNGPKTYVLDVQTLSAFAAGAKADGETELVADFFTIYYSAKTKIDTTKNKTWPDGYTFAEGLRLNWGGTTAIGETTKNAIEIVVDGTATVKVWWICGGDGREIGIFDENGDLVVASQTEDVFTEGTEGVGAGKNGVYLSELSLDAAGKYYIGTDNTNAVKNGGNIICKVEVTVTPSQGGSNTPALNGQGTYDEPFVLPETGDYVAAFPGGYDLVYYKYTTSVNGYVTLFSNWNGAAWLKIGTDIYNLAGNDGNGSVKVFALAGTPVYFGVADWDEKANDIPFTVSVEEVTLGSVENYVGAWKGEFSSFWGTTTLIFEINADGTGTAVEKGGWTDVNYTLTAIVVGDVAIVTLVDEYGNPTEYTFSLNADGTIAVESTYLSGTLTTYDPTEQPPVNPDVNYNTVIGVGSNTLYFSAEEIAANAASRTANITVAGNYKFASGNLFVASVVDANGNAIAKNDDYSYTLAEGEYTVNFGMLSMFGVSADSACTLNVEEVVPGGDDGGDVGGGDNGDDVVEFIEDEIKETINGNTYTFDGFEVWFLKNYSMGCYLANVYGTGYDLYFTYDVTVNDDGSYTITLNPVEHDANSGTEYIDTVLTFEIVIGGSTEECAHEYEQNMFYHPEMVPATCTTPGVAVFECIYCDHYYTQATAIDPEAHSWDYSHIEVVTPSTCTEDGVNKLTCSECGATKETVSYAGHDFEETIVAATCTTDGSYSAACKNCDYTESNVIPAEGHFSYYFSCGESGECLACGETFTKEHAVDPCEGGWCFNCYNTVEGAGHTWVNATCTAPKTCSVCDATDGEALGHDYDVSVTKPTCTTAGYTQYCCGICDDTYTADEVAATGHADANEDYKCDSCSTKMLPADGTALTIPQAIAVAKVAGTSYSTQKYYITGIVTNVYNPTYGNFYIKDAEGNEICIYGLYSYDGSTRYDAMSYKPVEGDEVTVYTVLGTYNSTCQGKNAWLDEVVAHEHDYTSVVTAPTCTKGGYTTHTCSICNGYYVDSEVEALGHTTENGVCDNCGQTIGGDVVANETFKADFDTVSATNSSYVSSTTTSGWKATNCAVMGGGTSDANPKFKVFGAASTRAFTLNGKTSAKGKLVSPTIADGLSYLTFNYTNCFSESNGVDITITIKQNGTTVATKKLDNNSVTKLTAYTFEWDLAAEGVAVSGDFTIEITNNSPTNSTSNKDRVSIWNLEWTTNK